MAITTSPHLIKPAPLDKNQSPKMASLTDKQAPATKVNGHSLTGAASPAPTSKQDVAGSTPAPEAKTDMTAVANSAKNADAFAANEQHAVQPLPTPAEAVNSGEKERKAADGASPAHSTAPSASAEATKHDTADKAASAEDEVDMVDDAPASSSKEEKLPGSTSEDRSAQAEVKKSAGPELSAAKPPSETTPAPAEKPASEAKEHDTKMTEAAGETQSTSQGSALGNALKDTAINDAVIVATHAHASSSSLLPSLRDDGSREQSFSSTNADAVMADAPSSKIARGREDDHAEERSAKRAKTEDSEAPVTPSTAKAEVSAAAGEMQVDFPPIPLPPRVRAASKEGSLADPKLDSSPISSYANREIRRVLASVKKTKVGSNFKDPVHKKWPMLWDSYILRVAKPMDITQMERNLREGAYKTHGDFIGDLFLIYENSVSFNGVGNMISDEAKALVDNFFSRLSDISSREPQRSDKKEAKQLPTRQTEPRAAAARRESRGAATSPIEESVTAVSATPLAVTTPAGGAADASHAEATTPVFAVPASGVPIIRRDSAKMDGDRPKRPIHPPKNRDLGYEPKNPKKKQPEFRFCEEVLKELVKAKHYETNHWFLKPVDAVAMQIPTYHKIIKKPMDLSTMQSKLNVGEYNSAKEFESDLNLIIKNCRKFNVIGEVVDAANRLEELFKNKWSEKDTWIAAHTTQASVQSPVGGLKDGESEEDGDDSEADGDEISVAPLTSDTVDALVKRLEEENTRLNTFLMAKIPDMTMITTQQTVLNMIQKQIVEEKTKLAAAEADRRSKKPAKAKTGRGKKGAGSGTSKKVGGASSGGGAMRKTIGVSSKKAPRARILGQAEKNVVTDGINNLDPQQLEKAIDIIKKDTHQEESESGELELDIDQLSQDALGKLYDLIVKAFPHLRVKTEKPRASGGDGAVGKPSKPKKHKPMGKLEQERNIEKLREIKAQFQRPGSGSQEPLPSVEVNQPVGDEESEEESDVDSEEE